MVVPILLILNERDMKFNIENMREHRQLSAQAEKDQIAAKSLRTYQIIQQHLLKQAHLTTVVPVNFHNIEHTLDTIHDIILEKIESKYQLEELNWASCDNNPPGLNSELIYFIYFFFFFSD